jgi:hypothetical protein
LNDPADRPDASQRDTTENLGSWLPIAAGVRRGSALKADGFAGADIALEGSVAEELGVAGAAALSASLAGCAFASVVVSDMAKPLPKRSCTT